MITVADVLNLVDQKKLNNYGVEVKLSYINFVDANIAKMVHKNNEYVPHTDIHEEVLLPQEFLDVYEYYLFAMIDLLNQEFATYNNYIMLYNASYSRYMAYYINSVPKSETTKITGL